MIFSGRAEANLRDLQKIMWGAYHAETFSRMKKLPKLESVLRRLTKPQRKSWQEQMAVMGQWAARMKTIESRKKK